MLVYPVVLLLIAAAAAGAVSRLVDRRAGSLIAPLSAAYTLVWSLTYLGAKDASLAALDLGNWITSQGVSVGFGFSPDRLSLYFAALLSAAALAAWIAGVIRSFSGRPAGWEVLPLQMLAFAGALTAFFAADVIVVLFGWGTFAISAYLSLAPRQSSSRTNRSSGGFIVASAGGAFALLGRWRVLVARWWERSPDRA